MHPPTIWSIGALLLSDRERDARLPTKDPAADARRTPSR
jgi:hypothetical protein